MNTKTHALSHPRALLRAALAACACAAALTANANPVLDQEAAPIAYGNFSAGVQLGQTFTVAHTGTLASIDIWSGTRVQPSSGGLTVDIRRVLANGAPDAAANALASWAIAYTAIPFNAHQAFSFDVTPFGIDVSAGDELAIVLTNTSNVSLDTGYSNVGANGPYWLQGPAASSFHSATSFGMAYRTYVTEASNAIPEPSGLALAALVTMGMVMRPGRRARQTHAA